MSVLSCISLATLEPTAIPASSVLCLGNFDGVHIAHAALIRDAHRLRDESHRHSALTVLCFSEPPSAILRPEAPVPLLCTQEDKLLCLRDCGAEYAILADFRAICTLSPLEFAEKILLEACHASALVCGFNYRFGRNAVGTPEMLRSHFPSVPLLVCEQISREGEAVSSTRIRGLLLEGRIDEANALLGHPFSLTAEVLHGKALGRSLGFPTVNQNFPIGLIRPRHGVYASRVRIGERDYCALSNVGVHPTVDQNAAVNCETYILDYEGDLYGRTLKTSLLHWIRPEMTFSSPEELTARINTDLALVKAYFAEKA